MANHSKCLQAFLSKIPLALSGKSPLQARPVPARSRGALRIVTNVWAKDAMDAWRRLTSGVLADGEVVWS